MDIEEMLEEDYNERDEVISNIGEWIKTLRSIKEILDNSLITDYQMETVRETLTGLIRYQVETYKALTH